MKLELSLSALDGAVRRMGAQLSDWRAEWPILDPRQQLLIELREEKETPFDEVEPLFGGSGIGHLKDPDHLDALLALLSPEQLDTPFEDYSLTIRLKNILEMCELTTPGELSRRAAASTSKHQTTPSGLMLQTPNVGCRDLRQLCSVLESIRMKGLPEGDLVDDSDHPFGSRV